MISYIASLVSQPTPSEPEIPEYASPVGKTSTVVMAPAGVSEEKAPLELMEHRDLLDIVDRLRSQGIGQFVDLPQIIVCGDQSSGKSSVLEAISGMSFPTKDNLCTRFATELILRRSPVVGVKVQINPGVERSSDEKKKLAAFNYAEAVLDISKVVEKAKDAMGLNDGKEKVFSTDILRVEISGPTQPHLTMVDLPGLFLAGNKDQSAEDAKIVESLVISYMKKPRSIILAVVSAKNDFALQQVTQHARALDPKGLRTLGLITKPDTLDEGSDSEKFFVRLAQNGDVKFRLGWHVLRNRSYATRETTTFERNLAETEFFSSGVWQDLDASQLGVAALRTRLSMVLRDQILMQLPSVLKDIQSGISQCQEKLAKLGVSRGSVEEQRRYLLRASSRFSILMKAAIDGQYTDIFFSNHKFPEAYPRRLRAVVQNTLSDFAQQMRMRGHAKIIQDAPPTNRSDSRCISRDDYVQTVKLLMSQTRGRELPGTYNPLIVTELFAQQCEPWKAIVYSLTKRIVASASQTVAAVIYHIADKQTGEALLRYVIGTPMENLKGSLAIKIEELLEPHLTGHPITYNHYLTENVQKMQIARERVDLEKKLKTFFGQDAFDVTATANTYKFSMTSLVNTLTSSTEPDMDKFSCSMATDMMQSYYKVCHLFSRTYCSMTNLL